MEAAALCAFTDRLGIPRATVVAAEAAAGYNLAVDLAHSALQALAPADLEALVAAFGPALDLTLGLPDAPPLLHIAAGVPQQDYAPALARSVAFSDDLVLRLQLTLEKGIILARHGLAGAGYDAVFYLFLANLSKLLVSSALETIDATLFSDIDRPAVILVSDASLACRGALLTIVGPAELADTSLPPNPIPPSIRARLDAYHRSVDENLVSWLGFNLRYLTPLHLVVHCAGRDVADLSAALSGALLHLGILYTANRTAMLGGYWEAHYANSERTVALRLPPTAMPVPAALAARLAIWPYGGQGQDRLVIFQTVVARQLDAEQPAANYELFLRDLRGLLDEARWHYRVFLNGQIDRHFEQVQKLEDYVAASIKDVSAALNAVTQGLSENLLAVVGVVILTLLASLIRNETQGGLFRIGMRAYAVYLVVFQFLYRMGSTLHSYLLLVGETRQRFAAAVQSLGRAHVAAARAPFVRRQRQFLIWFVITAVLYLLLAAAIWGAGSFLPGYLAGQGVGAPTPAATATATPVR